MNRLLANKDLNEADDLSWQILILILKSLHGHGRLIRILKACY